MTLKIYLIFVWIILSISCIQKITNAQKTVIKTGAENTAKYLPFLQNKNVAIVGNQSSIVNDKHLVDSLLNLGIKIKKIFCPEHGFRGKAEAGEIINSSIDVKTGLSIISLYGKNKKPNPNDLRDIDIVLFDIQDVGVRFYTYISTLHYVMEACAEENIPLIVLDRPNPNAYYIDGPILEIDFQSFVGMHPVPIVYGMTIGEYALMINGENWLPNNLNCNLKVIPLQHWTHDNTSYNLPIKPSPNLPNMTAINLYPSLCLFEGTAVSVGRGTKFPFQVFGHPEFSNYSFNFKPMSVPNISLHPKLNGMICYGMDLRNERNNILNAKKLNLNYLINAYKLYPNKKVFFNNYFNKLSGNSKLKNKIIRGLDENQIRESWQKDLEKFKKIRKKYLLYN